MFGLQSFYAFFFLFLVIIVLIFGRNLKNGKERRKFVYLCFFLLFFLAGMRGITVGGDLRNYLPEFHGISKASLKEIFLYGYHEPGYVLFVKSISIFSSDDRAFLLCTSFASLIGPFYLIYKYSKSPTMSVLLYFALGYYTNTFNNVRQSIAISIVFCSIPFLIDRKLAKYTIGIVFATCFHYSALIMLILYPITNKSLDFKKLLLYAVSSLSIVYFFGFVILKAVVLEFLTKYDPENFEEDAEGTGWGLFAFYLIVLAFMSVFYLTKSQKMTPDNKRMMSIFVLFQIGASSIQLSAPIFHSMVRMAYFFYIPVIILAIPFIYSEIRSKSDKLVYYISVFSIALYFMSRVYSYSPMKMSNSQCVIPYVFIDTVIF